MVISTIEATTTVTGLRVSAALDVNACLGRSIIKTLSLERHEFHGEWNYTLRPQPPSPAPIPVPRQRQALPAAAVMDLLTDPVLTGFDQDQLDEINRRFASAWPALAETLYQERSGRPRRHPMQLTHKGNFSTFDRILITFPYLRGVVTHAVLSELYRSDRSNACRLKQETARPSHIAPSSATTVSTSVPSRVGAHVIEPGLAHVIEPVMASGSGLLSLSPWSQGRGGLHPSARAFRCQGSG